MKVLFVATVQSHICQFHKPIINLLREDGWQVEVAARDNLAEKNGLKLDFADKVYDLPFSRSPKSKDNITAYKQLRQIIDSGNYDVVHCHTPMGGILTRLASRKARKNGTKVFYTAHGFHFYKGAPVLNWIVYYPIEKLFARLCDKVITINTEDYSLAKKKFKTQIQYIHGVGVDSNRYHPVSKEQKSEKKKELGFEESDRIILCIGELLKNKNQLMAINAFSLIREKIPECKLILAGNGDQQEALENRIKQLNLEDSVKLIGYCTKLENYQQAADVLVSCSFREGLGLNVIEAMLSGNPVVATENRGHKDLVRNGETGFLVACNDHLSLARKVSEIMLDEELESAFSKQAVISAQPFSTAFVNEELKEIYNL